jgi:arylsulfatase
MSRTSWLLGSQARVALLLLSLCLLTIAAFGRGAVQAQTTPRPNVIFIMVDALRADHVSAYGYARPTTPRLDAFMAGGARFAEATTPSSWTFPSNVSMLTGRMPRRIRMADWASLSAVVPPEEVMLAEAMKAGGYQTVGFVNNYFLDQQFGMAQGFDHYERMGDSEMAADLNQRAFNWLDAGGAVGGQPLFLFMYYYDPHTVYDPPPPYDMLYDPAYSGPLTSEVYGHGERVVSGEIVPTPRDVEHLLALYDGEITYWDFHLGQFLDRLAAEGLLDNALVVLTSDHGQMFGEHGKWVHRNSLYEEVLRVPLFLRYPGVIPAQVIDTPVFTGDLMPTVLGLVGLPVPAGLDGANLQPLLQGAPGPLANRPIYAEMEAETHPASLGYWIAPRYDLRSMKENDWKYILEFNNPAGDAFYTLREDSIYERQNALGDNPHMAEEFHDQIYDYFRLPTMFNFLPSVRDR